MRSRPDIVRVFIVDQSFGNAAQYPEIPRAKRNSLRVGGDAFSQLGEATATGCSLSFPRTMHNACEHVDGHVLRLFVLPAKCLFINNKELQHPIRTV